MESKKNLICKEDLLLLIRDDLNINGKNFAMVKNHIDELPTVEVEHGQWIYDGLGDGERICSVCRRYALYTHRDRYDQYITRYCPSCGARMDLEE